MEKVRISASDTTIPQRRSDSILLKKGPRTMPIIIPISKKDMTATFEKVLSLIYKFQKIH